MKKLEISALQLVTRRSQFSWIWWTNQTSIVKSCGFRPYKNTAWQTGHTGWFTKNWHILFSYEDALHRIKQNKHKSNESLFIYNLFWRQFVPIHRLNMQQSFSKVKWLHFWLASKFITITQSHFQRHLPVKQYPPGTRYHLYCICLWKRAMSHSVFIAVG